VSSFMGFVPALRPRLVISVVIDEPRAGASAGGKVAAPVFRRVAEMSLRYLGVRPKGTKSMNFAEVAEYAKGDDPATAAYAAINEAKGSGDRPPTGAAEAKATTRKRGGVLVPEVTGLPIRAALKGVFEAGLEPVIEGTGTLSRTEPPVGTRVPKGSKLVLVFEPQT
jgi:cell division protein FtsI (penicillin-binding protein 3)